MQPAQGVRLSLPVPTRNKWHGRSHATLWYVLLCGTYFFATGLGAASLMDCGASNCSKFLMKRADKSAAILS